jgi:acyl-CoA reductase-like NAD-dependent aldehyde dehydrogenase
MTNGATSKIDDQVEPAGRPELEAADLLRPGMLIGGQEVEAASGERLTVLDPATGQPIASVPAGGREDVDRAVRAARRAVEDGPWPRLDGFERARLINRFADLIDERLEQLYVLETLNNGRPVVETRAQLARLAEWYRYAAALLIAQRDAVLPAKGNYVTYLQRSPLGVCGLLTPFNHPMLILAQSLSGALAAGNTVVIKPSELTPLTTIFLGRLAAEAGIPDGVINVVTGLGPEAGAAIAEHEHVAKVNVTGGEAAGRAVAAAAARRFAKVTTELGGKTPVIVFDDVDLEHAVNGAAFAGFIAAGQTCICGSRLLVAQNIYDEFVERLSAKAGAIRVGDPSDPSTQMGPVISRARHESILGYVQIGRDEGARPTVGGGVPDLPAPFDGGYFVQPTVLGGVTNDMRVAQEEIFGPVVVAIPFTDEADAIAKANDSRFGLGAAIWTKDVARAHRVASHMESGICWINDHHRVEPSMPWGGTKDSGVGKECGTESFDDFSTVKAVIVRTDADGFDWYGDTAMDRLN